MPSVITLMRVSGPTRSVEADGVADDTAHGRAELLGHPLGDGPGGQPAGLRVTDQPTVGAAAEIEAQLGKLGALARGRSPRPRPPTWWFA